MTDLIIFHQYQILLVLTRIKKPFNEANKKYKNNKFSFHTVDVEKYGFEDDFRKVMSNYNIEKFDIVIGNYVVQHLLDPQKTIYKMHKFISKDGFICLRTSEDGSKVCYPDYKNLFTAIIDMNKDVIGMSNRSTGRKLYSYLKKSKFKNIKLFYDTFDTVNKTEEERKKLFFIQFIPRLNIMKNILQHDPDNIKLQKQLDWFEDALDRLEIEFVNNEYFYYCETAYSIIGQV